MTSRDAMAAMIDHTLLTPTASAEGVWIQVRCPLEAQWKHWLIDGNAYIFPSGAVMTLRNSGN